MDRNDYIAANRSAWDASAPLHKGNDSWMELVNGFANPGYSCLHELEAQRLEAIGLNGKSVAQLCCNNARELLSVKNLGAGRCVGFDQSEAFLDQGRELASIAGASIELVVADVFDLPGEYDGAFDIVLVTVGATGWMPDIAAFYQIAARLLRKGGTLLVHEQHPILDLFEPSGDKPYEPAYPYFIKDAQPQDTAIVYDGSPAEAVGTSYWFTHTLSDVVMGVIDAGMELVELRESPENISAAQYDIYAECDGRNLPISYLLMARKG